MNMMEIMMDTFIALIVAVLAIFLSLIAINVVLFFKLRSWIPQRPFEAPTARQGMHRPGMASEE